jgi:hypothetical protein
MTDFFHGEPDRRFWKTFPEGERNFSSRSA